MAFNHTDASSTLAEPTMRVSYSGSMSAFQAEGRSPTLLSRSKRIFKVYGDEWQGSYVESLACSLGLD